MLQKFLSRLRSKKILKKAKISKLPPKDARIEDMTEEQRMACVNLITDTDGYRVMIADARFLAEEIRDVAVLGANYGGTRVDEQLGTLGGAGLIASQVIQSYVEKYEEE